MDPCDTVPYPNTCIRFIQNNHLSRGKNRRKLRNDCYDAGVSLQDWLNKGGFPPSKPLLLTGHALSDYVSKPDVRLIKSGVSMVRFIFGCHWTITKPSKKENVYKLEPLKDPYIE
jgi:hypothetical protein